KAEFSAFKWKGEAPDPQDEQTFKRSKLNHSLKKEPRHQMLLAFHKELLDLRTSLPALRCLSKEKMDVASLEDEAVLTVRRWNGQNEVLAIFNFNNHESRPIHNIPSGEWRKRLDSDDVRWMGPGAAAPDIINGAPAGGLPLQPYGVLLYEKEIQD